MENNQKKVLKVHLEELKKEDVISGPLGKGKVHITFIDRKTETDVFFLDRWFQIS